MGYGIAAAGGLICVVAITGQHFLAFVAGSALFAVASATNLQARFAASDLARLGRVSTSMSLVVGMSTVGAVLGPQCATLGAEFARRVDIPPWAGAYALGAVSFLTATVIVGWGLRPDPLRFALALARAASQTGGSDEADASRGRPAGLRDGLAAIRASGIATLALVTAGVGHAVMIGLMTWTPLHMADSGQAWIGVVLSGHLLGMYAFAPVLGWLADRVGKLVMVGCGCILMVVSLAVASVTTGQQHEVLLVALGLLGLSWAMLFITGSGLFTEHIAPHRRAAAQGLFDAVVWAAAAAAQAVTGWLMDAVGYGWLCICGIATVAIPTVGVWVRYAASRVSSPRRD
ncbi:MAG TPA: MFS transporter [Micromonospora sp.]